MTMQAVIEMPARQVRTGKLPTVESLELGKYVVGTAVVRHAHRVIKLNEARRRVRHAREAKLAGNFFQAIVHQHEFEENSPRRIYLLAEVLGVDPGFEIAAAYRDPDAYFATCKSFSIRVPDFVRRRLAAGGASIEVPIKSQQKNIGLREDVARTSYVEALNKIREDIARQQERKRRRGSFDHPSLFDFEVAA